MSLSLCSFNQIIINTTTLHYGRIFGTIKKESCVTDLFYGVDYNSHLGTKRAGIVTYENGVFKRAIHNIENSYFRSKFEAELPEFSGNSGIGVISDTDAQPSSSVAIWENSPSLPSPK